jgi:adenylate kinase
MYLVLLGPPGAGKGTQAERLEEELHLPHVASGDLFRENLKNETELGLLAKEYMDKGDLVPDDVTIAMVRDRLQRPDCDRGAVLDGFPYHTVFSPPVKEGVCDACGGALYQRDDDKPETVRARLKVYHQQTSPLIDYYRQAGLLVEVDGAGDIETVSAALLEAARNLVK